MPSDYAKDFSINQVLLTPKNGEPIDLHLIMIELNIHEDLYNTSTYGNIVIRDSNNQLKDLPIFGFEDLFIDFNTPDQASFSKNFRIYKISKRALIKERYQTYTLHFTTPEVFTNTKVMIQKSYKGQLISDIAADIQTNFLDSDFETIDETKYLHHIIVPNWSPFKALGWLLTRANASKYQGSNYFYFENQDGFHFRSAEGLVSPENPSVIDYLFQPANVRTDDKKRDIKEQVSVITYEFASHMDVLDSIIKGMYGNTLTTHNIIRKVWREKEFNYSDSWMDYKHVEPNVRYNPITKMTGKSFLSDQEGSDISTKSLLRFYPSEDGVDSQLYPNKVEEWMGIRLSQLQQMQNIRLNVTVPGDSRRKVGEVVDLMLPSPEPIQDNTQQMDSYYRGRYLITSLWHNITLTEYTTIMELTKDAVYSAFP